MHNKCTIVLAVFPAFFHMQSGTKFSDLLHFSAKQTSVPMTLNLMMKQLQFHTKTIWSKDHGFEHLNTFSSYHIDECI